MAGTNFIGLLLSLPLQSDHRKCEILGIAGLVQIEVVLKLDVHGNRGAVLHRRSETYLSSGPDRLGSESIAQGPCDQDVFHFALGSEDGAQDNCARDSCQSSRFRLLRLWFTHDTGFLCYFFTGEYRRARI